MKIKNEYDGVIVDELFDGEFPTLVIEVGYELGGISYFTGNNSERGIYVYFKRMEIGNGFRSFAPLNDSNFKVLAAELKRKSQKRIDMVIDYIQKNAEELANLYSKGERQSIVVMLKNIK